VRRTADLSTIIGAGSPGISYRQGMVVAFNTATGENTIEVGGTEMHDLPAVVGAPITVGKPVGILVIGSQFLILGRVALGGVPLPG